VSCRQHEESHTIREFQQPHMFSPHILLHPTSFLFPYTTLFRSHAPIRFLQGGMHPRVLYFAQWAERARLSGQLLLRRTTGLRAHRKIGGGQDGVTGTASATELLRGVAFFFFVHLLEELFKVRFLLWRENRANLIAALLPHLIELRIRLVANCYHFRVTLHKDRHQ